MAFIDLPGENANVCLNESLHAVPTLSHADCCFSAPHTVGCISRCPSCTSSAENDTIIASENCQHK